MPGFSPILHLSNFFISADRFQPEVQVEQAGQYLEDMQRQNQIIENVINQQREQNPAMDEILSKLVQW